MIASHLLTVWDAPVDGRRAAWLDPRIAIFGGAFLVAFAIGVPFVVVDQARFLDAMRELAHALRTGDVNLETSNGWWHHLVFSLRYGMGLPMLTAGIGRRGGHVLARYAERRAAAVVPDRLLRRSPAA